MKQYNNIQLDVEIKMMKNLHVGVEEKKSRRKKQQRNSDRV